MSEDVRCPICKKFKTVAATYCTSCGVAFCSGSLKAQEGFKPLLDATMDRNNALMKPLEAQLIRLKRIIAVLVPVSVLSVMAAIAGWVR